MVYMWPLPRDAHRYRKSLLWKPSWRLSHWRCCKFLFYTLQKSYITRIWSIIFLLSWILYFMRNWMIETYRHKMCEIGLIELFNDDYGQRMHMLQRNWLLSRPTTQWVHHQQQGPQQCLPKTSGIAGVQCRTEGHTTIFKDYNDFDSIQFLFLNFTGRREEAQ